MGTRGKLLILHPYLLCFRCVCPGIVAGKPEVKLSGAIECDEVYITAGHKGNPEAVKKKVVREGEIVLKGFGAGAPKRRKNHRALG